MSKHSPAPWTADRYDGTIKYTARDANDRAVLVINNKTGDYGFTCSPDEECGGDCYVRHAADEKLFLASPDLLLALKRAVEHLDCWNYKPATTQDCREGDPCPACLVAAEAYAAIAKAEPK